MSNIIPLHNKDDLEQAENRLRTRVKDLFVQVETTYWELAKALYEIYDGVPGGYRGLTSGDGAREARRELFRKWGYSSFEEYVEREIGIRRRSASNLRYAYWWFVIDQNLSDDLITQLKIIGRSKIYTLAGYVTKDNIHIWLENAKSMTNDELKKAIDKAKVVVSIKDRGDEALFESSKSDEVDGDGFRAPPAPESTHMLSTSMYDGQWSTWQAALDRAKNVTNSDKISHNLEMICIDYLASNDFADPKDDLKRSIAKFEKLIGHKIIAIDTKSGKPVYGGDLLWLMVKQRETVEAADSDANDTVLKHVGSVEKSNILDLNITKSKNNNEEPPSF